MVANICLQTPPPLDPGYGVSRSKFKLFSEHGHVAYQIKENHKAQKDGSKYFAHRPPTLKPWGWCPVRQNSTFSENDHVAYQIKENKKCNNMVATILPANPAAPTPIPPQSCGWGQKIKIEPFQNMDMLHIDLRRITNAATW